MYILRLDLLFSADADQLAAEGRFVEPVGEIVNRRRSVHPTERRFRVDGLDFLPYIVTETIESSTSAESAGQLVSEAELETLRPGMLEEWRGGDTTVAALTALIDRLCVQRDNGGNTNATRPALSDAAQTLADLKEFLNTDEVQALIEKLRES